MHRFEKILVNGFFSWYHGRTGVPRVLAHLRRPVPGPILEVGCGTGATTVAIRRHVRRNPYTAIDCDPTQVERARRRVGPTVTVEEGDVTRLAYPDGHFGLVIEMNVLHHIPDPLRGLQEISRVLAPGGQFLFMDYAWKSFPPLARRWFPPESTFSSQEFTHALLAAGFGPVVVEGDRQITGSGRKPGAARVAPKSYPASEAAPIEWRPRRHPL